ncbi:pantothenate synthetase-like [Sitodiplosis mosellana]|uniref:pantothenate synthetase-like n=1 Tax=Sitodiplosis mosellana TaxID=263140 RepID=UPI0024449E29|nr:pantothenate synthetase-like [Sitodiplosis mosellana]
MVQVFNCLDAMRKKITQWKREGLRIALVPTMGNLHEGHYSMVTLARQHADKVIATIFVNPTQFGPNEDFDCYPRTPEGDILGLEQVSCDAVWIPTVETMYPLGIHKTTQIHVPGVSEVLEAVNRPTHFDSVATVVARLFLQVQPDIAVFGRKDYQQLAVIRQMTTELNFPIQIIGADTIREEDGLAKSSRNQYLSAEQRLMSTIIYRTLLDMREGYIAGRSRANIEADATAALAVAGFQVEYAVLRTPELAEPTSECDENRVALIAAVLGRTRLIDHLEFSCPKIQ